MENTDSNICPFCGNTMAGIPKQGPELAEEVRKLITKASIAANQRVEQESNPLGPYDDGSGLAFCNIREYFNELREQVDMSDSMKELLALKDTITRSELKTQMSLERAFKRQRETLLAYVNSRIDELLEREEGYTEEELKPGSEFMDMKAATLAIIKQMQSESGQGNPIPFKNISERLGRSGLKIGDMVRMIEKLKREGEVFEPRRNYLQVI